MPVCTVCRRQKKPRGRDAAPAMANSLCDADCPGYGEQPLAGHLWPGESRGDDRETLIAILEMSQHCSCDPAFRDRGLAKQGCARHEPDWDDAAAAALEWFAERDGRPADGDAR